MHFSVSVAAGVLLGLVALLEVDLTSFQNDFVGALPLS